MKLETAENTQKDMYAAGRDFDCLYQQIKRAEDIAERTGRRSRYPKGLQKPHQPTLRSGPKTGRNDPCPCGSGKKHKHCCLKNGT